MCLKNECVWYGKKCTPNLIAKYIVNKRLKWKEHNKFRDKPKINLIIWAQLIIRKITLYIIKIKEAVVFQFILVSSLEISGQFIFQVCPKLIWIYDRGAMIGKTISQKFQHVLCLRRDQTSWPWLWLWVSYHLTKYFLLVFLLFPKYSPI